MDRFAVTDPILLGVWQTPSLQSCFALENCNKDNRLKRPEKLLSQYYPSGRTWGGKICSLFAGLCIFSTKTGTRRIMHLDGLSLVLRRSRRFSKDSSSRRKIRLVPVFILKTHNQTNYKCFPRCTFSLFFDRFLIRIAPQLSAWKGLVHALFFLLKRRAFFSRNTLMSVTLG